MSDTLIIGIMTTAAAMVTVGLNIFWMGKTFEQLNASVSQIRDSVKDLAARMDKQFERVDRRFEAIDRRFEGIEGDLKQFYKLQSEQAAALQSLRDRSNPGLN